MRRVTGLTRVFGLVLALSACGTITRSSDPVEDNPPAALPTTDPGLNEAPLADAGASYHCNAGDTIILDGTKSSDDGTIVRYSWAFGTELLLEGVMIQRRFDTPGIFEATLTVTDDKGLSGSATTTVVVNALPTAIAGSTVSVNTGDTVLFDATSSSDPDGPLARYDWTFPDGDARQGAIVSKVFAVAGTFVVTLTVTDAAGATATSTRNVYVGTPAPANIAPSAVISVATTTMTAGGTLTLVGDQSSDPDGSIASRSWDFGDGGWSTAINPTHSFTAAGTYTVRLTVRDNDGASASTTVVITAVAPIFTAAVADVLSDTFGGLAYLPNLTDNGDFAAGSASWTNVGSTGAVYESNAVLAMKGTTAGARGYAYQHNYDVDTVNAACLRVAFDRLTLSTTGVTFLRLENFQNPANGSLVTYKQIGVSERSIPSDAPQYQSPTRNDSDFQDNALGLAVRVARSEQLQGLWQRFTSVVRLPIGTTNVRLWIRQSDGTASISSYVDNVSVLPLQTCPL